MTHTDSSLTCVKLRRRPPCKNVGKAVGLCDCAASPCSCTCTFCRLCAFGKLLRFDSAADLCGTPCCTSCCCCCSGALSTCRNLTKPPLPKGGNWGPMPMGMPPGGGAAATMAEWLLLFAMRLELWKVESGRRSVRFIMNLIEIMWNHKIYGKVWKIAELCNKLVYHGRKTRESGS